jgi:spore maturation protein CgeB
MKVLVIGSDKVFAIENFYLHYLRELGVDVKAFNAQSIFFDYYEGLFNKLIFKLRLSRIYKKIARIFEDVVEDFKPDIIWVFKGMEISPESLIWAKSKGIKLVNYNPDNPFIFTGKGSGNSNVTKSIGLYDLHFSYNKSVYKRLIEDYNTKAAILPFGFDISEELYKRCSQLPEIIKTCFLGNPDSQRAAFIKLLADAGIEMDVYGNNWNRFISHRNVKLYPPVYGDQLWMKLRQYRVQLNLMRIHNDDSHNMRTFEVPGIGGIMVAPETPEHREYWEKGKEVFLFKDLESCISQIRMVLAMPSEEADFMRNSARSKSINSGYSYRDRTIFVKREFEKLVS